MTHATNLLNYNRSGLERLMTEMGEAPFRGRQLMKWIHQRRILDFSAMTDINKILRQRLEEQFHTTLPEIAYEKVSRDGTVKWLMRFADGNSIETVFIPEESRGTLCVSSQVGCALNCHFCSTGKEGFNRNLSTAEIIAQVWLAKNRLAALNNGDGPDVTNVVMMGMGEPLLNYDAVVEAMDIMLDDLAYGLSKYRVTLSTSGVVPAMHQLAERSPVSLAVSLHAPNDALRTSIVPINKKYPLDQLLAACGAFFKHEPRRQITMEYVMLKGVNDAEEHAHELSHLLKHTPAKINLIPFNPFPGSSFTCSSRAAIERFQKILWRAGFNVMIRKTRGDDIDAACGQLVGKFSDRTKRRARLLSVPVEVRG